MDPILIRVDHPNEPDLTDTLVRTLSRVNAELSWPEADLRVVAELGEGDLRSCLNALAVASPSPAVSRTGFESWLKSIDLAFAAEDNLSLELKKSCCAIKRQLLSQGEPLVSELFSLHPSNHCTGDSSICALYGVGFCHKKKGRNHNSQVFIGSSLCDHVVISDSMIVFRIPQLGCGTHRLRLIISSDLVSNEDSTITIMSPDDSISAGDSHDFEHNSFRILNEENSRKSCGRRRRVIIDDEEDLIGEAAPLNDCNSSADVGMIPALVNQLLDSRVQNAISSQLRQIPADTSVPSFVRCVRSLLEQALQEVVSDFDVANCAFSMYERLRSLLHESPLRRHVEFELPDPFSLLRKTREVFDSDCQEPSRKMTNNSRSVFDVSPDLSIISGVMEILSDADCFSNSLVLSYLSLNLEYSSLDCHYDFLASRMTNVANDLRIGACSLLKGILSIPSDHRASIFSNPLEEGINGGKAYDHSGTSSRISEGKALAPSNSFEDFESHYLRCITRRGSIFRFYRRHFAGPFGSNNTSRLRKMFFSEFALEIAPMISKLASAENNAHNTRNYVKATRRSSAAKVQSEYVVGLFNLSRTELMYLQKIGMMCAERAGSDSAVVTNSSNE